MKAINSIVLPSFLRRCMKAYAIKAIIRASGAELNRVGRSRNWQVEASFEQITAIIEAISQDNETSWQWVATLLRKQYLHLSHEALFNIANKNPGITINELMMKTDCTILQARRVIDEIEWSE